MLDALERVHQWRELVGIFPVHQDHFCFGMFEDIGELWRGQAEVEGYQHGAKLWHGKERLQHAMTVRGQHRYLVTLRHSHVPQGVGQTVHARFQLMIGIAPRTIDHGGLGREQTSGTAQKVQRQERLEHGAILSHEAQEGMGSSVTVRHNPLRQSYLRRQYAWRQEEAMPCEDCSIAGWQEQVRHAPTLQARARLEAFWHAGMIAFRTASR